MIPLGTVAEEAVEVALSRSPRLPFFRYRRAGRLMDLGFHPVADPLRFARLIDHGSTAAGLPGADSDRSVRLLQWPPNEARIRTTCRVRSSMPLTRLDTLQLRAADLADIESAGIAVENHTMSRPCRGRCDTSCVASKIAEAHAVLPSVLAYPPTAFAYPNGNANSWAASIRAKLGYRPAFRFDHLLAASPPPDRFDISKLRMSPEIRFDRFRIIVSRLHLALIHMVRRS
jgi:hypothetical protein